MISSLFTGISGMNANSDAMGIIGDNIANINTVGFKGSRASFANILSKSLTGFTGNEIGRGVSLSGINTLMDQGSLETSDNPTDMAIHGNGFFIVNDDQGASSFTRAGEFRFDKSGQLVDNNALVVQGWDLENTGLGTGGPTVDIKIPGSGSAPPVQTSEFMVNVNLDTSVIRGGAEDTFSNTLTVYDSLGSEVDLTMTFEKTANPREWKWMASIPSGLGSVTTPPGAVATSESAIDLDLDKGAVSGSTFSNQTTVSDSLGNEIDLTMTFEKTANPLEWKCIPSIPSELGSVTSLPIVETSEIDNELTLNSAEAVAGTFSNTVTVYDSLGNGIDLTMTFEKTAPNTWKGIPSIPAGLGTVSPANTADITFDPVTGAVTAGVDPIITLSLVSTAVDGVNGIQDITWKTAQLTEDAASATITQSQNGNPPFPIITFDGAGAIATGADPTIELNLLSTAGTQDIKFNTTDLTAIIAGNQFTSQSADGLPYPTLTFDENGQLPNGTDPTITLSLLSTAVNGVNGTQDIIWNVYENTGVSTGKVTGLDNKSATTFQSQDGYSAGILQSMGVDEEGTISGVYSNGTIKPLFQIALADFPSYTGLVKAGGNLYMQSLKSGQPMMGVAGTGGLGGIIPNTLEMSNVDLAAEFVSMITTQRAFQANSRVITTSDEILQELINLKR